jgi:hypothetical protein
VLVSRTVTVGTTAVDLLDGIDVDRGINVLINPGSAYFGGSDVTTTNGYQPSSNVPLYVELHGDSLYAISGSSTTVRLLIVGKK